MRDGGYRMRCSERQAATDKVAADRIHSTGLCLTRRVPSALVRAMLDERSRTRFVACAPSQVTDNDI